MGSVVTVEEVNAFYDSVFKGSGEQERVLEVRENYARVRQPVDPGNLRPGGYINGPTQMAIADSAAYIAIFTRIGITPMALTSNLNINFMRKPGLGALTAEARILKLGRSLCVGDVLIFSGGADAPVAQASLTYAIPPRSSNIGVK